MTSREPQSRAGRVRASELNTIDALEQHASACRLCRLCRERTQVVTASGPYDAEILVVAEAPGYHEDREGRLLTGRAGELFDELLVALGTTRDDVFLTSVVKCRPPTGRTPFPDEVEACEGWLFREIALVRPRVVVTLGALALRLVTGRYERLADVHGSMLHAHVQGRDVVVWPLFHPAAAVHVQSLVDQLHADTIGLAGLLRGARVEEAVRPERGPAKPVLEPADVSTPAGDEDPPDSQQQLTMEL